MTEQSTEDAKPKRKVGRPRMDKPHATDVHVGSRVRLRRTLLGMSQEKLGDAIGLTFQQVQKYERGANRIGASRLFELANVLEVPVQFFFEDMPQDENAPASLRALNEGQAALDDQPLTKRETLELVRNYYKIEDLAVRRRIFDMIKALGRAFENGLAVDQADAEA